jgi:hypothetical protein
MRVIKASILGLLNVGSMEELRRTLISIKVFAIKRRRNKE